MQKTDLMVALAGFLILGAAVAGAAVLEEGDGTLRTYDVKWETDTRALEPKTESFTGSGSSAGSFPASEVNLSEVRVRATITHPGPRAPNGASISLTVTGPDNFTKDVTGTLAAGPGAGQSTMEVAIPIQALPAVAATDASSPTAARAGLAAAYGNALGTGDWDVRVDVTDNSLSQGTFSVEIAFEYDTYHAILVDPAAVVGR